MSIDVAKLPDLIRNRKQQVRLQIGDIERVLPALAHFPLPTIDIVE